MNKNQSLASAVCYVIILTLTVAFAMFSVESCASFELDGVTEDKEAFNASDWKLF